MVAVSIRFEGSVILSYDLVFDDDGKGESVPGVYRCCPDRCCTIARGRTFDRNVL